MQRRPQNKVSEAELEELIASCKITVLGHELSSEEVSVAFTCDSKTSSDVHKWEAQAENQTVVLLDCSEDEGLLEEGLSREMVNRVQKLRKEAKLQHDEQATALLSFQPADGLLWQTARKFLDSMAKTTGSAIKLNEKAAPNSVVASSHSEIRNEQVEASQPSSFLSQPFHFSGPARARTELTMSPVASLHCCFIVTFLI